MERARKSNRVSWATGVNLCQVKLFLSEDCPSKVGQKSQDLLQVKTSSMLHSETNESNDLPPGFEGNHFLKQSKDEVSRISQIKWECPPLFIFSYHWRVAAGEESRDKEDQKLRETRVLEAVYPRLSAIPPSPSVSLDAKGEDYDDNLTPLIPIIPIEEEESMNIKPELDLAVHTPTNVQSQNLQPYISATTPISIECNSSPTVVPLAACGKPLGRISHGLDADLAAASAVVAAIMKSNEQGSLIDMDLLVRIFNDPIMIEKLITEHTTAAASVSASSNAMGIPTSGLKPAIPSVPLSTPAPDEAAAGTTTNTVGLLPSSGLKPSTLSVPLLKPTPDKPAAVSVPAIPSVSVLTSTPDKPATLSVPAIPSVSVLTSTPDKLATPSVLLSRSMPGKPATPSVPLPTPTPTPTPHMHMSVNKNIHRVSNGVIPEFTQPPQQDTVMASGVKQAVSSSELSTVPLPSAGNLHEVVNQVQSIANTMLYQPIAGSAFAMKEAYPLKDANYYKNLVRQHGADKQDMQDSQIGIRHSNFQDMKSVHNIKPGEVKFKIQKPCIYFKGPRGCRNGSNCPYQHDMSAPWGAGNVLGAQHAKRLKLGPEI